VNTELRYAVADTSVVIDPGAVGEQVDAVAVSVLTIAELQYGVTAVGDPVDQ